MSLWSNRKLGVSAGLILLITVIGLNYWGFVNFLGENYFQWYLSVGPFIGLAIAIIAAAFGNLEKHAGLISAHPLDYLGASLQACGLPIYVLGTHLKSSSSFHLFPAIFLAVMATVAMIAWLILVVPLQYFVYLVCASPARVALRSSTSVIARFRGHKLELGEQSASAPLPEGWWDASMRDRPVVLTNAFSAALLFLADKGTALWNAFT